jgi:hypothetical protein
VCVQRTGTGAVASALGRVYTASKGREALDLAGVTFGMTLLLPLLVRRENPSVRVLCGWPVRRKWSRQAGQP